MAEKKPTDSIAEVLDTIGTGISTICENQKALHADQKFLLERFSKETDPLYEQLTAVLERLDAIERIMHDDVWTRRMEGNQ